MTGEQTEKISTGYLNTMKVLYDEIKKMEGLLYERDDNASMENFYSELLDGRREVYEAAKNLFDAESSKENALRMRWAGAMCAMVAAGKAGCIGPATRESVLDIMKWHFGMDSEAALDALDAASYTGVIKEEEGTYRLR